MTSCAAVFVCARVPLPDGSQVFRAERFLGDPADLAGFCKGLVMSNEFEKVLDSVDLEDGTEETLDEPGEEEQPDDAGQDGEEPASPKVAETDDDSHGNTQDSDEAASTTPPAKAAGTKAQSVPLAAHLETKHQLRDARMRLAQLEAEKMMPAPQQPVAPSKSPMEEFIEKEGEDSVPPAKVLLSQRQWETKQTQTQTDTVVNTAATQSVHVAVLSMTEETMGEGLGFETLLSVGRHLLTQGDVVDIKAAGKDAGALMYQRLLERTVRSGTPQGKLVKAAYLQAKQARAGTPKTKQAGVDPAKNRGAPSREEVISPKESIQGADDLTDFFFG